MKGAGKMRLGWGLGVLGLAAAGAIAFAVTNIGGSASAQTGRDGPLSHEERYRELLADELGISVEKLTEAELAARDRLVDEALAEGRLGDRQARHLKSLDAGEGLHLWLGGHMLGHRLHSSVVSLFEAAAAVVGVDAQELRERLAGGESLVDIAESQDIDEDTLQAGLVDAVTEAINEAVDDGYLDRDKADVLLEYVDRLVERAMTVELPSEGRFRFGPIERFWDKN